MESAHLSLNPAGLGYALQALFLIELAKHERQTVDSLLKEISLVTEVRSSFLITGRYDLVVHVVARDTEHLKNLAFDHFTYHSAVTRIETSIIYEDQRQENLLLGLNPDIQS